MATFAEHKKILKQIEAFKPQLNKLVEASGVIAVNHFTKSFSDGGFTDESLERWKPRKRAERGKSRAVLVKSGRLRRSLRSRRLGNLAIKIMTDVPYARVHNNGEGRMPKRQFIGYSGQLNRKLLAFIDKNIKKQFNK
jgi:phage gpG-like protein